MKILKDVSLNKLNTFGINVDAKYFCEVASVEDIKEANDFIRKNNLRYFVLGGGSNVLFRNDYNGLIIKTAFKGIKFNEGDSKHVVVTASAAEVWDDLVKKTVMAGLGGLENLSLIPGSVGAAPVQNIGAYGVEIKDVFDSLVAYDLPEQRIVTLTGEDCKFGYRNSIFKNECKGRFIIISVDFKLSKFPEPKVRYGAIKEELKSFGSSEPSVSDVRKAVCNIRQGKLPDPAVAGNAGSFFKNPEIDEGQYNKLKRDFPGIVSFPMVQGKYKIAAGWLIEYCGWKGKRLGNAGVYEKQALVLVNFGGATSQEILELSEKIKESVFKQFDISLESEVNIV